MFFFQSTNMFILWTCRQNPAVISTSWSFDSFSAVVPGGHACWSVVVPGNGFSDTLWIILMMFGIERYLEYSHKKEFPRYWPCYLRCLYLPCVFCFDVLPKIWLFLTDVPGELCTYAFHLSVIQKHNAWMGVFWGNGHSFKKDQESSQKNLFRKTGNGAGFYLKAKWIPISFSML